MKTTGHGQIELHSNLPASLYADQLLIATNAFAKQLLPSLDVEYARGQVLVTAPIKKIAFKGTFHFDEGYYYFRNLGNRILLGGARNKSFDTENTDSFDTTDLIQQELERFLHETIMLGARMCTLNPTRPLPILGISFTPNNSWMRIEMNGGLSAS